MALCYPVPLVPNDYGPEFVGRHGVFADGQASLGTGKMNTGTLQITATRPPDQVEFPAGRGGTLTFQAKASGQTPLTITRGGARDPGQQAITVNGAQASVTVHRFVARSPATRELKDEATRIQRGRSARPDLFYKRGALRSSN